MLANYNEALKPLRKAQGSHCKSNYGQPLQGQPTKIRQAWIDLLPKTNDIKKQNLVYTKFLRQTLKALSFYVLYLTSSVAKGH